MEIKILSDRVSIPKHATSGSAAIDLVADIEKEYIMLPSEVYKMPTGIAIHINDNNIAGLILPRSGLGTKGLVLANTIGLIDSDYQGEIILALYNRSKHNTVTVKPLQRVAQMIFINVTTPQFKVVKDFSDITKRGKNGFGHTG